METEKAFDEVPRKVTSRTLGINIVALACASHCPHSNIAFPFSSSIAAFLAALAPFVLCQNV